MKDVSEQEVIDLDDMDVEAFNELATEQGWSDGMPLFVPTEAKVRSLSRRCVATTDPTRRCHRVRSSQRSRPSPPTP